MSVESKRGALPADAWAALTRLDAHDQSVAGVADMVSALRYAEGTLVGILSAVVLTDPTAVQRIARRIDSFITEVIAVRLLPRVDPTAGCTLEACLNLLRRMASF